MRGFGIEEEPGFWATLGVALLVGIAACMAQRIQPPTETKASTRCAPLSVSRAESSCSSMAARSMEAPMNTISCSMPGRTRAGVGEMQFPGAQEHTSGANRQRQLMHSQVKLPHTCRRSPNSPPRPKSTRAAPSPVENPLAESQSAHLPPVSILAIQVKVSQDHAALRLMRRPVALRHRCPPVECGRGRGTSRWQLQKRAERRSAGCASMCASVPWSSNGPARQSHAPTLAPRFKANTSALPPCPHPDPKVLPLCCTQQPGPQLAPAGRIRPPLTTRPRPGPQSAAPQQRINNRPDPPKSSPDCYQALPHHSPLALVPDLKVLARVAPVEGGGVGVGDPHEALGTKHRLDGGRA